MLVSFYLLSRLHVKKIIAGEKKIKAFLNIVIKKKQQPAPFLKLKRAKYRELAS